MVEQQIKRRISTIDTGCGLRVIDMCVKCGGGDMSQVLNSDPELRDIHVGALFDHVWYESNIGFALVGMDNRFLAVNPTLSRWLRRSPEELRRMKWMEVTDHDDIQGDLDSVESVKSGRMPEYEMDKNYLPRGTDPFPAKLTVRPFINPNTREEILLFFSQIERRDSRGDPISPDPDIVVVQRWVKENKRYLIIGICAVAVMGEGFFQVIGQAITKAAALFGG